MEKSGQIDPGSMSKLRSTAKAEKLGSYKQLQMLAQALAPCVGMDSFLPKVLPPGRQSSEDALCKLPLLICTADEERKQKLDIAPSSFFPLKLYFCN
jgi:hypothetical protein